MITEKSSIVKTCTRCILNSQVPGISFDNDGVCNFCHDLKDISNINLLCEKHYICNSCIKIDEFDDCKNCGYKYYYYKY